MATLRESATDTFTVGTYKLASLVAQVTPGPLAYLTARLIGYTASASLQSRRSIIERHIQRVKPELSRRELRAAVQGAFDSYARYYVESFRLPGLPAQVVHNSFTLDGFEGVIEGLGRGKGVILALPHLGGWEWAGRWLADQRYKATVVVEPLQPPELFEWFTDLRTNLGMNVVPLGDGVATTILHALRDNHIVCLLCDRDLKGDGLPVTFFGETTTLPAGPVTLAIRSGAPLITAAVYFTDRYNGHHAIVRPPIDLTRTGRLRDDVAAGTQKLATELESLIRRAPEQWHMFQPNWPSDPGFAEMRAAQA
jgi:KDO2-lipid IV(A) lauroyltransferase